MSQKTYSQLKTFVQDTLDLRDEDFITDDEFLTYVEEALKFCEAEVHKLNIEDQYFEAHAPITLSSGKFDYSLPSNIYANKVLRLLYSNGTIIRDIQRITNRHRYSVAENSRVYGVAPTGEYGYRLINNDVRSGVKLRMFPTPTEAVTTTVTTGTVGTTSVVSDMASTSGIRTGYFVSGTNIPNGALVQSVDSSTQITLSTDGLGASVGATLTFVEPRVQMWYIRSVSIPTAATDYIDFPEFWHFVAQHVIVKCLRKEIGNPRLQTEMLILDQVKAQVLETLSNMVPDQNDELEKDTSIYEDMNERIL